MGAFCFNWNIIDLHCCANLRCTTKWLGYTYARACMPNILFFIFSPIMVYHRILNIAPCFYTLRPKWFTHSKCSKLASANPRLPSPSLSPHLPLGSTKCVLYVYELCLFCRQVHLCHINSKTDMKLRGMKLKMAYKAKMRKLLTFTVRFSGSRVLVKRDYFKKFKEDNLLLLWWTGAFIRNNLN